jgi:hypothetical protein
MLLKVRSVKGVDRVEPDKSKLPTDKVPATSTLPAELTTNSVWCAPTCRPEVNVAPETLRVPPATMLPLLSTAKLDPVSTRGWPDAAERESAPLDDTAVPDNVREPTPMDVKPDGVVLIVTITFPVVGLAVSPGPAAATDVTALLAMFDVVMKVPPPDGTVIVFTVMAPVIAPDSARDPAVTAPVPIPRDAPVIAPADVTPKLDPVSTSA